MRVEKTESKTLNLDENSGFFCAWVLPSSIELILSLRTFICVAILLCLSAPALAHEIDLSIISRIESSNREDACSYKGCKYGRGLYQISEIVLKDWNNFHPDEQYLPSHLFQGEANQRIADWYFGRIVSMLKYYNIPTYLDHVLACWNWGIGNVKNKGLDNMPQETIDFINKYKRGA